MGGRLFYLLIFKSIIKCIFRIMKKKVYRVVVVQGVMIAWASSRLFTTEQRALTYIKRLLTSDDNLYGYDAKLYDLDPWCRACLDESASHRWLTVHIITTVIDKTTGLYSTYGIVAYDLD